MAGGIEALVIDPVTPTTLYAAAPSAGGIFKSTDAGASWTKINALTAYALAIDRATPSTLYAATQYYYYPGGEYPYPVLVTDINKSTDSGVSWTALNAHLSAEALVIDPMQPTTLYAGTSGGTYKSTDGGVSWAHIEGSPAADALAFDPTDLTTLYAGTADGVYNSGNGGVSWTALGGSPSAAALAIDPLTPATLYAGGSFGVVKSTDGGASWAAINTSSRAPRALAIDPANPAVLYAGTRDGVFRTADGGASWTTLNTGLPGASIGRVVIDPMSPSTLYAGSEDEGVYKSTDAGASWTMLRGAPSGKILVLDPRTPTTLYAGGFGGFAKSTDGGATWTPIAEAYQSFFDLVSTVAIDPVTPTTIYVGLDNSRGYGGLTCEGVARSLDGGVSWGPVDTGLTDACVQVLTIDPASPATLYAGTGSGVCKSTDGAIDWRGVYPPFGSSYDVEALAVDPAATATVYAGIGNAIDGRQVGRVVKSSDGGASWMDSGGGLPQHEGFAVQALAIDPATPTTVYAGTADDGVFRSTDGGGSWTPFNTGLSVPSVQELAVDPSTGATVFAATTGGVFDFETRATTTTTTPSATTPSTTTPPCASIRCTLEANLASPACRGEALPEGVTRRFDRAVSLVERVRTSSRKRSRKLVTRAKHVLERAEATVSKVAKRKRRKLSPDCAATLKTAIEKAVGGLGAP